MELKYKSVILFLLGFIILMFTRSSAIFPTIQIAILIAPVFILRFIRTQTGRKGIWLTLVGFLLSMNIALWGMYSIHNITEIAFTLVRSSLIAVLYFLPFLADKLLYTEFKKYHVISTLIFPVAAVSVFFLFYLDGPLDGVVAKDIYSYGPSILQQLNSLFGLWGFIFLFSWSASTVNYLWENKFNWRKTKNPVFIILSVFAMILLFGVVKMGYTEAEDTVKVASIILLPEDGKAVPMTEVYEKKLVSPYDKTLSKIESITESAAENNAKIVAFQEYSVIITEPDEKNLFVKLSEIAGENKVYLSLSYAVFAENEKGKNKAVLIDDEGNIVIDYTKRYLLGYGTIGETAVFKKGAEIIQSVITPYGRIALSICRDMNFPAYIRQAAEQNVDIMISPSYDNPKSLKPAYYERSIEFGFSTIRPTFNGISYMEDYNGRIISSMDSDAAGSGVLYGAVPINGIRTIYGLTGDLFCWICMVILIIISIPFTRNKLLKLIEK